MTFQTIKNKMRKCSAILPEIKVHPGSGSEEEISLTSPSKITSFMFSLYIQSSVIRFFYSVLFLFA